MNKKISKTEMEIIKLVAKGLDNKTISEMQFVTIQTVKTHLFSIYKKLGISNNNNHYYHSKRLKVAYWYFKTIKGLDLESMV